MAVTLSVAEVEAIVPNSNVSTNSITVAANVIRRKWGIAVDSFIDDYLVDEADVKQAWAIVSARLHDQSANAGGEGVTSESQLDYSVAHDAARQNVAEQDLLYGLPTTLLVGDSIGQMIALHPGQRITRV